MSKAFHPDCKDCKEGPDEGNGLCYLCEWDKLYYKEVEL